jgi:hypothetical protein
MSATDEDLDDIAAMLEMEPAIVRRIVARGREVAKTDPENGAAIIAGLLTKAGHAVIDRAEASAEGKGEP